jgi:hypothetical protein
MTWSILTRDSATSALGAAVDPWGTVDRTLIEQAIARDGRPAA